MACLDTFALTPFSRLVNFSTPETGHFISQGRPLMQLVAPDILSDACGLSVGLIIVGIILGLALWLFGWSCHRFWIVLITTVLAGIYGLYDAAVFRAQPLVAAVLLALIGGLLAPALGGPL